MTLWTLGGDGRILKFRSLWRYFQMEGNMRARSGPGVMIAMVSGIRSLFPVGNWPDPL